MKIAFYKRLNRVTIYQDPWEVELEGDNLDKLIFEILEEHAPEELYINGELDEWALKNGYVKGVKG